MGISCERNSSYSFVPIVLKLCMCFPHGMRMCMWIAHNCWISFCHFLDIVNLVIFHPEYIDSGCLLWVQLLLHFWNFVFVFFLIWFVKVCRCFYATNENIHVLSMKFPHLFLWPEIIITFLWGWEWVGSSATPLSAEFWLEYNHDTSQLCRTGHDDVSRTRMTSWFILSELFPLDCFRCNFVSAP